MLAVTLLYALGKYTPVFWAMYEVLPGVSLYRRPADATFPFGLMLAVCGGYLVHRWLMARCRRRPLAAHRRRSPSPSRSLPVPSALAVASERGARRSLPLLIGVVVVACAIGALRLAYRLAATNALAAAAVLALFSTADLAWNNRPNESTGLPPSFYDALRPDTTNETVALLKQKLAATAAPDRRDRVELIGIGYHWPNLALVHGFDHLFGHNPLRLADFARATNVRGYCRGAGPAPVLAAASLVQFRPRKPVRRALHRYRRSDRGDRQAPQARRPAADRANQGRLRLRKSACAAARLLVGDWRLANFADVLRTGQWPDADPRRTVLLERAPRPRSRRRR